MIEIKNLTKYYGAKKAVDDISFTVPDKEIVGFLGPNGAGKSTTMNIITGFLPATSGKVSIDGYDISAQPKPAKRRIGYLPEFPPLYTEMRVLEYLKFVAGIKEVAPYKRKAQISRAMEILKITGKSGEVIKNLSKGYKQRVGFAQALLGEPKALILDEPTVGLDPSQIIEVRKLIKELKKEHSVILSSHVLAEVETVADRIIIISDGAIKANDTIENLAKLSGNNILLDLTVEGSKSKIFKVITSIDGVLGVIDISQTSPNIFRYRLECAKTSCRREILQALVKENYDISEIRATDSSLEEIFVKLTKPAKKKTSIEQLREMAKELEKEELRSEQNAQTPNKDPAQ